MVVTVAVFFHPQSALEVVASVAVILVGLVVMWLEASFFLPLFSPRVRQMYSRPVREERRGRDWLD